MTDYTPETEEIISAYTWAVDGDDAEARAAEARRWLADHDRKIAAEALREAANDMHRNWCQEDGPSDWLDIRADRIERGGES